MKIEITENKVFMAGKEGEKDQPVPKGTILSVDKFPGHLVGKARIVEDPAGKSLVANIEGLRARYEALHGKKPDPKAKPETLQKAIAAAEAKLLDELRTEYFELTEQIADESLDIAALQATIAQLKAK